ncbi:nitrogen regulation protein NR(II) [Roseateles oligotrophus]|uniref:Uncharacterized protein n=1 Tax=Roseateles oligotrophus TaxID=1769250 RepID=A0ABT2YFS3_9BURK|nr:hypothetical protein [Roseateles oligotrophus]MCV2368913.1 hypothetical protein [Roseateles oligotrophus]
MHEIVWLDLVELLLASGFLILLRRSEESLRITIDANGLVTRMNRMAEALGRPLPKLFELIGTISDRARDNPAQRVIAFGKMLASAHHTTLLAGGGAQFQIADIAMPIREADGRPPGVVPVFSAVSEPYRLQADLATGTELLERSGALAKVGDLFAPEARPPMVARTGGSATTAWVWALGLNSRPAVNGPWA